jgi:hypothetical protein
VYRLEESKPQFTGSCIVGVRSSLGHRDVELLEYLLDLLAPVVRSAVVEDQGPVSPSPVLHVELPDQVSNEDRERLRICVGLGQREVRLSKVVKREEETHSRRPPLLGHRVWLAWWLPLHPAEVLLIEPGLVNVYQAGLLLDLHKELHGPTLPEHQVPH